MITPSPAKKPSSEVFAKTFHVSREQLTKTAAALGLAHYQPFSEGQIYDDLIVGLYPYGIYTFNDDSQAHVVGMNGGFYIYVSKSPEFKNPSPPKGRKPLGFRPIPNGHIHPKHDEPKHEPPTELQALARRTLETLRSE